MGPLVRLEPLGTLDVPLILCRNSEAGKGNWRGEAVLVQSGLFSSRRAVARSDGAAAPWAETLRTGGKNGR
jgi:hypothetical protein